MDRFSLAGRITLITGATRGLGLEIARGMAAAGATVGVNGRDAGRAREVAGGIPRAFPAPFDITDTEAASAALDAIVARHGALDCLVNNAAVRDRRPLADITPEDFRRLVDTNLVAQYALARVAARHMAARGRGRLVFISSMVGPQSFQGDPAYVASKGGLEALMRALAVELGPRGIAANAIAPGFFLTEGNAPFFDQPRVLDLARRIPLQRFGRPEELVGAAIFLASDAASYVTGQVLTVDAGLSIAL
jgi:gluconate 5-dehydrogenase